MFRTVPCLNRDDRRRLGAWAVLSLALHLAWEIAQLQLYTIAESGNLRELTYAVLHCSLGDMFIATGTYILTMYALGDSRWPSAHPWKGAAIAMTFGIAYTVYSEWYNVYQAGNWAYAPAMPRVFGVGVSPLLQWLVVPVVAIVIWNMFLRAGQAEKRQV